MQNQWRVHRFEIVAVGTIIIGFWLMFYGRVTGIRRGELCQSNLKQVSLALMIYVRDYDEKFPIAARWEADVIPYTQLGGRSSAILHCPSARKNGYSFSSYLDGIEYTQPANPALTPMLFESSSLKKSQHDKGISWLLKPRHPQGTALAYVDGHVEWRQSPPPFKPILLPSRYLQKK